MCPLVPLVVVEETPPPFYVKHFEYPEKRSINYYYYLYCQWSPLLIQYAHSVRLEAALHNTPQKLDWQKRADIGHWFIFTLGLHFIYFFSNSHWQSPTNSNRHVWQVSLNHCIALCQCLFLLFGYFESCLSGLGMSEKWHTVIWWLYALVWVCQCSVN